MSHPPEYDQPVGWMLRTRGVEPHQQFIDGLLEIRSMRLFTGPINPSVQGQFRQSHAMCDKWAGASPPGFDRIRSLDPAEDPLIFMLHAAGLQHPADASSATDLPPEILAAIDKICDERENIVRWRLHRLARIKAIAASVEDLSVLLRQSQPIHAQAPTRIANLAFVALVAEAIYWPDTRFFYEYAGDGHPICGVIKDVGIFPLKKPDVIEKELEHYVPLSQFRRRHAETIGATHRSMKNNRNLFGSPSS